MVPSARWYVQRKRKYWGVADPTGRTSRSVQTGRDGGAASLRSRFAR